MPSIHLVYLQKHILTLFDWLVGKISNEEAMASVFPSTHIHRCWHSGESSRRALAPIGRVKYLLSLSSHTGKNESPLTHLLSIISKF